MRTTSNQIRYERIFRRLGIPYATQSMRTLFLEAPLNDMYAALQLAAYPDDRAAYAALLRSPFVNLADGTIIKVLLAEGAPFESLPQALEPEGEEAQKFAAGGELYRHVRQSADLCPISGIVDDLWYRFGYRYTILRDAAYHPYLEYYDYFRELAAQADREGRSLVEFLDSVRPNLGKYEKLGELEVVRDQSKGVQLLTIHKAKGLEFPVVILANAGNLGRSGGEGRRPYYLSDEFGLTLRVTEEGNYFYAIAEEENRRKEAAELKRLLYVALTRARSHLIVSGCHNRQNRRSSEVLLNMFMQTVGQEGVEPADEAWSVSPEFSDVLLEEIPSVSERELMSRRAAPSRERIVALTDAYRSAESVGWEAERTVWTASEISIRIWQRLIEPSPEVGLFPAALDTAESLPSLPSDALLEEQRLEAVFGSLVHVVIARSLDAAHRPALRDLPRSITRNLESREAETLFADALALAETFLDSELGCRAQAASRHSSERPFLLRCAAGRYLRGSFDLVFVEDGVPFVVDFKTDRELRPAAHAPQLHVYRIAAGELYGTPARAWLFYLRGGRTVEVDDDLVKSVYDRFLLDGHRGALSGAAGTEAPGASEGDERMSSEEALTAVLASLAADDRPVVLPQGEEELSRFDET